MKFKVGDRVRGTKPEYHGGRTGIVRKFFREYVVVSLDGEGADEARAVYFLDTELALRPGAGLVAPKNRSRVDAGPRWMG